MLGVKCDENRFWNCSSFLAVMLELEIDSRE